LSFVLFPFVCCMTIGSPMAVIVDELETSSEEETTDSNSSGNNGTSSRNNSRFKCPFCYNEPAWYNQPSPKRCEHLLCEVEYVESNNEMVSIPDHPIVASLFGVEVPRVIALRFMNHLRSRSTPRAENGVRTISNPSRTPLHPATPSSIPLAVIKHSVEDESTFTERTYYLSSQVQAAKRLFAPFVRKHYEVERTGEEEGEGIPFSRISIGADVMTLQVEDLVGTERCRAGNWVMITGFPDDMPTFFFSVSTHNSSSPVFLNHSASLVHRMQTWHALPSNVTLYSLSRLPTVALN